MKLLQQSIRLPASLTIPAKTQKIQEGLIALAKAREPVADARTQEIAVDIGRKLRALENAADAVCNPIIKELNDTKKEAIKLRDGYKAPLAEARLAIEREVSALQVAEAARVLRETEERSRQIAELSGQPFIKGDVAMQELVAYRNEQATEELMRAPSPEPVKAKGAATRQVLKWECTDAHALYMARPDLCFPPQPKGSAIQLLCVPGMPNQPPGLRLEWETKTSIRE